MFDVQRLQSYPFPSPLFERSQPWGWAQDLRSPLKLFDSADQWSAVYRRLKWIITKWNMNQSLRTREKTTDHGTETAEISIEKEFKSQPPAGKAMITLFWGSRDSILDSYLRKVTFVIHKEAIDSALINRWRKRCINDFLFNQNPYFFWIFRKAFRLKSRCNENWCNC